MMTRAGDVKDPRTANTLESLVPDQAAKPFYAASQWRPYSMMIPRRGTILWKSDP